VPRSNPPRPVLVSSLQNASTLDCPGASYTADRCCQSHYWNYYGCHRLLYSWSSGSHQNSSDV